MQRILLTILLGLICWLGLTFSGWGQGSNLRLESRIDRLESEISQVRSRLNQLAARSNLPQTAPALPPAISGSLNEPALEERFDNLATLAIEMRQDLRDLQSRVNELEEHMSDR
ncbi:MAG: hypothetical protein AAGD09_26600 [Cyanobacteria bacterium P01_F01_bin.56]